MKVTPGVRRTSLVGGPTTNSVRVDRFHYPAGGHTHWHLHTAEQVLYGEVGHGWVQFEGGAQRNVLDPGSVVHVPVGRKHWHGAMPDHAFVHLAVTAGGDTVWLGELTPEEYLADAPPTRRAWSAGEVVDAFIAAIERKDLDTALELVTDDIVYDNVPIGPVTGPEAVRGALRGALGRAERVEWVVHHQLVQNDVVMNDRLDRFLIDGQWVEVPVAGLFVHRDGRIALWRDYFDLETYRRHTRSG